MVKNEIQRRPINCDFQREFIHLCRVFFCCDEMYEIVSNVNIYELYNFNFWVYIEKEVNGIEHIEGIKGISRTF